MEEAQGLIRRVMRSKATTQAEFIELCAVMAAIGGVKTPWLRSALERDGLPALNDYLARRPQTRRRISHE
jgi:hypothetical protein